LSQKNEDLDLKIPPEALSLIAERGSTNIRELEGLLQGIIAKADAQRSGVTAELVRDYFGTSSERRSRRLRPASIIAKTAQYFNFKPAEILGQSRKAPLVRARHITAHLLKLELRLPYEQIGDLLGGRDHTTIMHGVEKIEALIAKEPELGRTIADIKQLLAVE
jgi:chromosomal replication initiator protein